jgi:hypothetical protein
MYSICGMSGTHGTYGIYGMYGVYGMYGMYGLSGLYVMYGMSGMYGIRSALHAHCCRGGVDRSILRHETIRGMRLLSFWIWVGPAGCATPPPLLREFRMQGSNSGTVSLRSHLKLVLSAVCLGNICRGGACSRTRPLPGSKPSSMSWRMIFAP